MNGTAADGPLSQADVGALLRTPVAARTVGEYRRSYAATYPFPAPSGTVGNSPYWTADQVPAIKAWDLGRPGRGKGGGRPPRKAGRMSAREIRAEAEHRAGHLIHGIVTIDAWPSAEEYGYTKEDAAAIRARLLVLAARLGGPPVPPRRATR